MPPDLDDRALPSRLLRLAPRPARFGVDARDKSRALGYFRGRAAGYGERVSAGLLSVLRERERRAVLEGLALEPGRTLIDVGCGGGFYALAAKGAGLEVTALDALAEMVDGLRGRVDRAVVGDVESLDGLGRYDRVVCAGVLEFVLDPGSAFSNLARLVAPGGRLVLLVPSGVGGRVIYRIEKRLAGFRVNVFAMRWLEERGREAGLTPRSSVRPLPTNLVMTLERLLR